MKQWWLGLSLREKQIVSIGSMMAAIFIIYAWIWSPLNHKINTMRTQITQNQELLNWMQLADKQLENTSDQKKTVSSESLLSLTQHQIKQSTFANQLSELRQGENDTVQLSFKQISFDNLITWLMDAGREQGLTVTQMTVTAYNTPGIVSAELQLTSH